MMNTCRILLRELLAAMDYEPELASEFEKILKNDVKLLLNPDKKGTLSQCVEGSRMQRTHYIRVIEHHVHPSAIIDISHSQQGKFFAAMRASSNCPWSKEKIDAVSYVLVACVTHHSQVEVMWVQYWALLTIACDDRIDCTENQWLFMARQWCTAFETEFQSEDVTTCFHVFVCHDVAC